MATRIFIGKIASETTAEELEDIFKPYGEVGRVDVKNGYAFAYFDNDDEAQDAIKNLDGVELHGRNLVIENARNAREFKQRPVKRFDLRVSVLGIDSRTSWQDLKDWARAAGDVTFSNVFDRDGETVGVVEFQVSNADFRHILVVPWSKVFVKALSLLLALQFIISYFLWLSIKMK